MIADSQIVRKETNGAVADATAPKPIVSFEAAEGGYRIRHWGRVIGAIYQFDGLHRVSFDRSHVYGGHVCETLAEAKDAARIIIEQHHAPRRPIADEIADGSSALHHAIIRFRQAVRDGKAADAESWADEASCRSRELSCKLSEATISSDRYGPVCEAQDAICEALIDHGASCSVNSLFDLLAERGEVQAEDADGGLEALILAGLVSRKGSGLEARIALSNEGRNALGLAPANEVFA